MNVEKIAKILNLSAGEVAQNSKKLDDCDAMYFWNPVRGGISMIVAEDGEYLSATSAVSFEKLLEEFKTGRRNGKLE